MPQGIGASLTISKPCYNRFAIHPLLSICRDNPIPPQGDKVLKDQEVRAGFCYVSYDAPRQQAFEAVLRYTGTLRPPEWMDVEQGSVLFQQLYDGRSSQADQFKTLCHVQADLSTAPCQERDGIPGRKCYTRGFDVILLVGLTELKAQIAWIDSETVSSQGVLSCSRLFSDFSWRANPGDGKKVQNTISRIPP